jgi:hypothetical protein
MMHHIGKLYLSEEAWEEKWHLLDGEKNPGSGSEVGEVAEMATARTEEAMIQGGRHRLGQRIWVRTSVRNASNSATRAVSVGQGGPGRKRSM